MARKAAYIIGGRLYAIEKSIPLCEYEHSGADGVLYQSPKGRFFTIESGIDGSETAVEIEEAAARSLMENYTAGIIAENYARVFGEPEQG